MALTESINHLGLAVRDLNETTRFFVEALGWQESGRDDSYPRTAVTDGHVRLTLWQVNRSLGINPFHRRKNIGLHHGAGGRIGIAASRGAATIAQYPGVAIEFMPELVGAGPRKHMMCSEPGGIRIEFIWNGA